MFNFIKSLFHKQPKPTGGFQEWVYIPMAVPPIELPLRNLLPRTVANGVVHKYEIKPLFETEFEN